MQTNREWISISDLMSGLMMVFLFISVSYMVEVEEQQNNEFKKDLKKWDAEILADNTIRFKSPKVLFKTGKSQLSPKFQKILNDFFPRYLKLLNSKKFKNEIFELKIEGHTSSIWNGNSKEDEKYLKNMSLSQDRAKAVLEYCYLISKNHKPFLRKKLRANGMAYSNLILTNKKEDIEKSQRVEFRVLTKSEEKITQIIEELK